MDGFGTRKVRKKLHGLIKNKVRHYGMCKCVTGRLFDKYLINIYQLLYNVIMKVSEVLGSCQSPLQSVCLFIKLSGNITFKEWINILIYFKLECGTFICRRKVSDAPDKKETRRWEERSQSKTERVWRRGQTWITIGEAFPRRRALTEEKGRRADGMWRYCSWTGWYL